MPRREITQEVKNLLDPERGKTTERNRIAVTIGALIGGFLGAGPGFVVPVILFGVMLDQIWEASQGFCPEFPLGAWA